MKMLARTSDKKTPEAHCRKECGNITEKKLAKPIFNIP